MKMPVICTAIVAGASFLFIAGSVVANTAESLECDAGIHAFGLLIDGKTYMRDPSNYRFYATQLAKVRLACGDDGTGNIEKMRRIETLVDLAREAPLPVQYMATDADIVANARKALEMQMAMAK